MLYSDGDPRICRMFVFLLTICVTVKSDLLPRASKGPVHHLLFGRILACFHLFSLREPGISKPIKTIYIHLYRGIIHQKTKPRASSFGKRTPISSKTHAALCLFSSEPRLPPPLEPPPPQPAFGGPQRRKAAVVHQLDPRTDTLRTGRHGRDR